MPRTDARAFADASLEVASALSTTACASGTPTPLFFAARRAPRAFDLPSAASTAPWSFETCAAVSDPTSWAAVRLFSQSIPAGELGDNAAMAPAPRVLAASRWTGSSNAARCAASPCAAACARVAGRRPRMAACRDSCPGRRERRRAQLAHKTSPRRASPTVSTRGSSWRCYAETWRQGLCVIFRINSPIFFS